MIAAAPGSKFAAVSSNVSVAEATGRFPPACDINTTDCPPGPTSNTSTSDGRTLFMKSCSVTVTRTTCPVTPATEITDGYGAADRCAGSAKSVVFNTVIGAALLNAKTVVG